MKNIILFICIYFLIYLNFIPNQMSVFSKNEDLVDWFHKYKKDNISVIEGFRLKVKYYFITHSIPIQMTYIFFK